MSTPFLRNGVLVLGVKKTRRVTTDYTLQATDSEVLVDGRLQAVNIAFPAVETLVMSSYWTITIEQWGMGVAVNGQAVTVNTQKVVVFFNLENKEFNMSYQKPKSGSTFFAGNLAVAPTEPVNGTFFILTAASLTLDGKNYYKGDAVLFNGTAWQNFDMRTNTSLSDQVVDNTDYVINNFDRQTFIYAHSNANNTKITFPLPTDNDIGKVIWVHATVSTGKNVRLQAPSGVKFLDGSFTRDYHEMAIDGETLEYQVSKFENVLYYTPV